MKAYEIAHEAGIHPSTLSRIINGIDELKPGDPRILRIARVLRLRPEDCFEIGGGMKRKEVRRMPVYKRDEIIGYHVGEYVYCVGCFEKGDEGKIDDVITCNDTEDFLYICDGCKEEIS